ncbi:MAG: BTAD domain-containing putative transcriptional regulator [Cyclobacterium sp.]|uniref:BTAD domain-containing putative transcriptional regulator n=1 Tax=Cyclobacterium sp. TaxID=1966343 RepID=UPI003970E897
MTSPAALLSPTLKIKLLGGFAVHIEGQMLSSSAIKGRKARSLLKLLAHQRQYQMVRDHAVDILWPELEADAANAQLYKALYHIRKAFAKHHKDAGNWIGITDELIKVSPPGGLVTDTALFTQSARIGLRDKNTAELENALSYYSGDFLPMDRYSDWASFPREHYRQLYLDVLTSLAEAYENQGDLSEAAELMRLALDKEPTLETAHGQLMRIFVKMEQPTRAFRQYEVCRQTLRDELGISPSPNTRKILDDVAEVKLREKKEASSNGTSGSSSSSPLIGRAEACAALDQSLEDLSKGVGGCMAICGGAGLGKTRLVEEFLLQAREKRLNVFMGSTHSDRGNRLYGPFIDLFEEIISHQSGLKNILPNELGRLIPGFAGRTQTLALGDKRATKGYLFAQVHRFFCQLSLAGPVIIILEDLHAADRASNDLLAYLIEHRGRMPLLYVLTFRNERGQPLSGLLADLQGHLGELIELGPFTYEEHIQLLQSQDENGTLPKELADIIYQLAEGNPFYALELFFHYRGNGNRFLSEKLEGHELPSAAAGTQKIPPSISKILKQKLESHSPAARQLLFIAAVLGRQVPYKMLSSMWKVENNDGLFNALEEVLRSRILEENGLDYTFRHALDQETIYASIGEAHRQMLHQRVAEMIVEMSSDTTESPAELIAWHYLGAKDWMEAAHYLLAAGRRADNVYAHENALQRYREAYDVINKEIQACGNKVGDAKALKAEIMERTGDVYRASGQLGKSYEAYEEALSLDECVPIQDQELQELHRKMAVAAIFRKDSKTSKKHLDKACALQTNEPGTQERLLITKALYLWNVNQLDEAYGMAQKAFWGAKEAGMEAEASQACEILAMTCLPLCRFEEGLKYEEELEILGWSPEILLANDLHRCLGEFHVDTNQPLQKPQSLSERVSFQVEGLGCVSFKKMTAQEGSPARMAYSHARKGVLLTLTGNKALGWQTVQDGFVYAMQAGVGDHCLRRLYAIGIWNRVEAHDLEQAGILIENTEKLLAQSAPCPACILELYPWFSYYFLQIRDLGKAQQCCKAIAELSKNTGNPTGRAMTAMIKSSFCVAQENWEQAGEFKKKSRWILENEVPEAVKPAIADYIKLMDEQQRTLQPI